MSFYFKVYVDDKEIYSGNFDEVPEKHREKITRDLGEWADSLGKRGLNELIYSHFTWYEKKGSYCEECEKWRDGEESCPTCGSETQERYLHERDKKLDRLMMCIGMISKVEVVEK